ncbi:RHS repeat domain-containing protein [Lysinibacillus sp. NPDC093692]|uniref:RHS repeat domain-containing protein n=1 Tax=Lysinibacillus sp. NPDC093692 TaxID=3390578 RepID=UPI003CFFDB4F
MAKVIKPDKTEVTFKYDSLGRRIEKCSNEKTIRFVWDGNNILHEFSENDSEKLENDNLVTWVFNDGFIPSAKITSEGNYSIISDYLGTPVEAYDDDGKKVWSAELDIYGRVVEFTGEQDFILFRYQGQYEDVETGLYYNRFRYYSPSEGMYTQPDPIGLEGGNPTLYGYVSNPIMQLDPLGLMAFWKELKHNGMGHHTVPRSHANQHGFPNLGTKKDSPSWFPYKIEGSDELHKQFHDALKDQGIPFNRPFNGSSADLIYKTNEAYKGFSQKGFVMIPRTGEIIAENVTVREGFHESMKWDIKKNSGGCN